MELVMEQTQQGTRYEVSVSAKGVEELKRKVKIKGEKKEAILTLRKILYFSWKSVKEILPKLNLPNHRILKDGVFRFPPYQFAYPEKKLTMDEMLAKFINEGKREYEEMEIFIK
ncbi:hypothetical protein Tco_0904117 [Tanacetum coccineum]